MLHGGLVMARSGRLELGDNIYGQYRFIFNHCDVFGQQRNRNRRLTDRHTDKSFHRKTASAFHAAR